MIGSAGRRTYGYSMALAVVVAVTVVVRRIEVFEDKSDAER